MNVTDIEPFVVNAPPTETYWGARAWSAGADHEPGASGPEAPRPGEELSAAEGLRGRAKRDEHVYPPRARRRYLYSQTIDTVLVRLRTSDGVVGWGEAKAPVGAQATATLVRELVAPLVIGSRLDEIPLTWDRVYTGMRVRGHDAGFWLEALAGVDIALWDAWATTLGQPVHALAGGRYRESVPVYASGVPAGPAGSGGQAAVRSEAKRLRDLGFEAVKVAIGARPEDDIASVRTVREVFGTVFVDAAGQYEFPQALYVGHALEELGLGFFEMPLPPEDLDGYARLAARLRVPLALDSLATRYRALEFLRAGALHVLQPDVCRAGGITETMRIAALADAFGAQATPHVSIGSAVHVAASVHCAAAIPNCAILEEWIGTNPLRHVAPDALPPATKAHDVPTAPGLGITIDEHAVRRLAPPIREG